MGGDQPELARDGFTRIPGVLGASESSRLFDAFLAHVGPNPETNAYGVLRNNVWARVDVFREILLDGRIFGLAASLLGIPELVCFQDNVILKPAGTVDHVDWHQDYAYWPLDNPDGITLWIALTEADVDNGCLHFLRGTHLMGERCPTNFVPESGQPQRPDLPLLDPALCEENPEPLALEPGGVVAHHPFSWHMSPPNLSQRPRCGWSITFVSPEVRWDPAHAPHPFNNDLSPLYGDRVSGPLFPRFSKGKVL